MNYNSGLDQVSGVAVDHKGVTGVVTVMFQRPGVALVHTEGAAHNNNAPALTYRGKEYLVHQHFYRQDDGSWTLGDGYRSEVRPRGSIGGSATAKQTEVVREAMASVIARVAEDNPDTVLAGARYEAQLDVDRAQGDVNNLAPKLEAAQLKLAEAKAALEALG